MCGRLTNEEHSGSLKFCNGALGTILMSFAYTKGYPPLLTVCGENGIVKVSRAEMEFTEIQASQPPVVHPKFVDSDFETGPIVREFEIFRDAIEYV